MLLVVAVVALDAMLVRYCLPYVTDRAFELHTDGVNRREQAHTDKSIAVGERRTHKLLSPRGACWGTHRLTLSA